MGAGPYQGLRTLSGEEELARAVLARLDPPQRAVAITSHVAPDDILTRHDPILAERAVLDLSDYQITDAGADALGTMFDGVRLRLRGNRITPAGADRLRRRFGEFVEV